MLPTTRRMIDSPIQMLRDFDRALNRAWDNASDAWAGGAFPVDIREVDDTLVVEAELPGFKKEQIDVNVEQGVLTIEAKREETTTQEGEMHLNERRWAHMSRRFSLPNAYDTEQVDASLADGVLTLRLPKREEVKPRKIEVK